MSKSNKLKAHQLSTKKHAQITTISLIVLAVTTLIASEKNFAGWERSIFNAIYNLPNFLTPVFLMLTQLGSAWMVLILAIVFWVQKYRSLASKILINGAITYFAAEYLKILVDRPRPYSVFSSIASREHFTVSSGFPSAHTAIATVLALTIMPYLPKKYYWVIPIWIGVVALSRIYLGVHAPLDVIGGAALGALIASLQHTVTTKRAKRRLENRSKSA